MTEEQILSIMESLGELKASCKRIGCDLESISIKTTDTQNIFKEAQLNGIKIIIND